MLGIKYEQAKDIAEISALGKKFSPGITEKTARYIKSLPKGSPEHITALAQIIFLDSRGHSTAFKGRRQTSL